MWKHPDNQEVGLEAAILYRKRNSSLVKWLRADNPTGLKHSTEAVDSPWPAGRGLGRGAFSAALKPDRENWWSAEK